MCALFNGNTQPAGNNFTTGTDYLEIGNRKSTFVGDSSGIFEQGENGDTVGQNDELGLWFRFDAPTGSPVSLQQTITVTITATAAD